MIILKYLVTQCITQGKVLTTLYSLPSYKEERLWDEKNKIKCNALWKKTKQKHAKKQTRRWTGSVSAFMHTHHTHTHLFLTGGDVSACKSRAQRSALSARTPSAARLPWRQELHLINIHLINANEAHARARITPETASYSRTIMRTEI